MVGGTREYLRVYAKTVSPLHEDMQGSGRMDGSCNEPMGRVVLKWRCRNEGSTGM